MGRRQKQSCTADAVDEALGGDHVTIEKEVQDQVTKIPNFLKRPFGRFKGLTRDNTVIGTPGLPYAWGFTYNTPYRYGFVKKRSDFEERKLEFDYLAKSILRGIRQAKHEVSMLKFISNPIFSRRQRAIQALDD